MKHKISGRCKCGKYFKDMEVDDVFVCPNCGIKLCFVYNSKNSIYELEIIEDVR